MGLRDFIINIMTANTNGLDDQFIYVIFDKGKWYRLNNVTNEVDEMVYPIDPFFKTDTKAGICFKTKIGFFFFDINTDITNPEFLECIKIIRNGTKRVLFDERNFYSNFQGYNNLAHKPLNRRDLDILEDECIQKFVKQLYIGGDIYVGNNVFKEYDFGSVAIDTDYELLMCYILNSNIIK